MNLFLKKLFRKPIYRVDILNHAIRHHRRNNGVCSAIDEGLYAIGINVNYDAILLIFPAHNFMNASQLFGAEANAYWWPQGDWSGGRMEYLLWLRDQYKDDKEDLRRYKTNACK